MQNESTRAFYDEHGYAIFRSLIPAEKTQALLAEYQRDILPSSEPFFRQSSNRWEKNRLTEHGYIQASFLDIHDYPNHKTFSTLAQQIYCSQPMRAALCEITGQPEHNLMQSMLFDQNTETRPHQDAYYLDTVPNGHLHGAWIALEDIREEAGRFFVVPGSHRLKFDLTPEQKASNHSYLALIERKLTEPGMTPLAPALRAGDVLFWTSHTLHGALKTQNRAFSRKSLTAHYMPSAYQFGNNLGFVRSVRYGEFEGMKYQMNPRPYSLKSVAKTRVQNFLDRHPTLRRAVNIAKNPLRA